MPKLREPLMLMMARCTGGINRNGEQTPGRIHLNGDEQNCAKHQSDNFSLLSTTSRVAARNRYPAFPPVRQGDNDDVDGGWTDTASSTATAVSVSALRPRSPDVNSETVFNVPPPSSSQRSIPINAGQQHILYELPAPVFIAPAARPQAGAGRRRGERLEAQRRRNAAYQYLNLTVLSLLAIVMYACYRYTFREAFQFQDEVIREHLGLRAK